MNDEDLMKKKLEIEAKFRRKEFGKVRISRKQLSPEQKKSKKKMKKTSQKRNRR